MKSRPVVCLMGPTASSKTDIALKLAEQFPIDLISVDSALVYRGMDVGTAKPDPETLQRVPHRLIDIRDPEDNYSAGEFVRDAYAEIDGSFDRGRIPLLVGGTMMYFRSLTEGIADLPEADPETRKAIDVAAAASGWPALHAELSRLDPAAASRINQNDSQRIQRALEVYRVSGKPLSEWQAGTVPPKRTDQYLKIALLTESRSDLHDKIEQRLKSMLENGFVEEVKTLMERPGLTAEHSSMRAVGYRQIWSHLEGQGGIEDAQQKALSATRQLAKRQLTWLRSERQITTVDPLESDALGTISTILSNELRG